MATTAGPELWAEAELGEADGLPPGIRLMRTLPHEANPSPQAHASPAWMQGD
ncbi:hypothetical protein [Streptomyces sp. NPDC042319]|uniref:hypothetical protein n=1 Tax=Streptomyces sp. NPDC042319 TaxID=3154332 RepID=UPI0033F9DF2B